MQMLVELQDRASVDSPRNNHQEVNSTRPLGMASKIQCPTFDGTNPTNWVKKCNRHFSLYKIAEESKVELAYLYMIDKAKSWVISYLKNTTDVIWEDFKLDLAARFKNDSGDNAVEHFNKLSQLDSLEEYIECFEELRAILL